MFHTPCYWGNTQIFKHPWFSHHTFVMKSIYPSNSSFSTFPSLHLAGALQINVNVRESLHFGEQFQATPRRVSLNCTLNKIMPESGSSDCTSDHNIHRQRRKKVHGNKGREPWNKGRKHTPETRALIKQRTLESLRDPQVRKKMAEHPRTHSDEIKKKIGSSLRQLWDKRLQWKKLREKFFLSWTKSIAELARKGGIDQQELDWDSYDKMKEEIIQEILQGAIDKAKAMKLAEITAEKAAQAKAEKLTKLAQKKKVQEEKAKIRGAKRQANKKSKTNADKLSDIQELTLKHRLTKIRKRSMNSQVITEGKASIAHSPAWKKLDLEIMKREEARRKVSLAEQIQAAKNKRIEASSRGALAESFTDNFFKRRLVD